MQALAERIDILKFFACEACLQICNNLLACIDADVSDYEQGLKFLENALVDLATGRQVGKVICEPAIAAIQARAQSLEETLRLSGFFFF
jgi:hypothetical protein